MKSQLIIVALICLISISSILAAERHHKKARKWAVSDKCVCSSALSSVCDSSFDNTIGSDNGSGTINCSCDKKKACECAAGATSGVLSSDKKTACQCLATCQKSAGGKALDAAKQVGQGVVDLGKAGVDALKSGASSLVGGAKDLANAAGDAAKAAGSAIAATGAKAVDAAKDAVDFCQCSKADFSKVAANSTAANHKAQSTMAIKGGACDCVEDCNCPQLNIIKRRFAKLQKQQKMTKARKLLSTLRAAYNGTFKNGDQCTCDENMVNKIKAGLANGVQGAKDLANAAVSGAKDLANSAVAGAKDLANKAGQALSDAGKGAKELAGKALDGAKDMANAAAQGAKNLANKAGEGLSNAGKAIGGAVSGAVGAFGEMLAGDCIPDAGETYKDNKDDLKGPQVILGKQSRSKGICYLPEKCQCDSSKQKELEVKSTLEKSGRDCTCSISSVQLGINKAKGWFGGRRMRLSKKMQANVEIYCQSLTKPQCAVQQGCSFSQQKQSCLISKSLLRLAKRTQQRKSQVNRNRNINRFKQVVFSA